MNAYYRKKVTNQLRLFIEKNRDTASIPSWYYYEFKRSAKGIVIINESEPKAVSFEEMDLITNFCESNGYTWDLITLPPLEGNLSALAIEVII